MLTKTAHDQAQFLKHSNKKSIFKEKIKEKQRFRLFSNVFEESRDYLPNSWWIFENFEDIYRPNLLPNARRCDSSQKSLQKAKINMSKKDFSRSCFFAALFASLEAVALTSRPPSIRAREFSGVSYSSTKRYTWIFHDKFFIELKN